eukprot:CAMPEP_0172712622 /NCGR_PEP_ID=MMETSP1074-20121228/61206_1 /TAXON_ID=2916 /ORGANISM="Ceratium fusus, Strain PA161109" /LENGTH=363 /DNA_ID=CAMNT_0013536575 /DNA_START=52 /DNA_END=1140 /DNA_ORIENTATION=+
MEEDARALILQAKPSSDTTAARPCGSRERNDCRYSPLDAEQTGELGLASERTGAQRWVLRALAATTLLAVPAILGLARGWVSWPTDLASSMEVITESSRHKLSPAFQPCKGPKDLKCEIGCMCVRKNEYFSMCKPLEGELKCNKELMESKLKRAKAHRLPFLKKARLAKQERKVAITRYSKAIAVQASSVLEASEFESRLAILRDNATREAVVKVRDAKVEVAKQAVAAAKTKKKNVKGVAEKEVAKEIKKAKDHVADAEDNYAKVKVAVLKEVSQAIHKYRLRVDSKKKELEGLRKANLKTILKERKMTASKLADQSKWAAAEAKKAAKDAEEKQKLAEKARKEDEDAHKKLKAAQDEVAKW